MLTLNLSSILVDDQDKALAFYTDVLGFVKKTEIPLGEFRWLTVIASHGQPDIELVLEPTAFPPREDLSSGTFRGSHPTDCARHRRYRCGVSTAHRAWSGLSG